MDIQEILFILVSRTTKVLLDLKKGPTAPVVLDPRRNSRSTTQRLTSQKDGNILLGIRQ